MKFTIKTFFIIILSLGILLPQTYASNYKIKSTITETTMSCCDVDSEESCNCSTDCNMYNKTCNTNCCCSNLLYLNQEVSFCKLLFFDVHSKLINTYNNRYNYLFHSNIYKPPINFLS
ncbi:MAG: hypothetical protein KGV59_00925 [Tenacibaculum sp.]|nr:hypothetical protein [Tenacibaculum sp.]